MQYEKIIYWDYLDSTMSHIERHFGALCTEDRIWIASFEQACGRGQWGRSFVSPRGGLYCTLVLDWSHTVPPGFISLLTALAIADALPVDCDIKWLNDLYIQGYKLGGILVEMRQFPRGKSILLISFGLNVNTETHLLSDAGATSLLHVLGHSVDMQHLFGKIKLNLYERIRQMLDQGIGGILRDLYPFLIGWQKKVWVTTIQKECVQGVWTGIDPKTGQIVLNENMLYWARSIVPVFGSP